jgi:hypothetical protein
MNAKTLAQSHVFITVNSNATGVTVGFTILSANSDVSTFSRTHSRDPMSIFLYRFVQISRLYKISINTRAESAPSVNPTEDRDFLSGYLARRGLCNHNFPAV